MDIEALNKEYLQFKSKLETARKHIEILEKRANVLAEDKIINRGKIAEGKRNGDMVAVKSAEEQIKKIDNELNAIKNYAIQKKEEMEKLQSKIDEKINEIKENPEMKKHLEEVMTKKYERKISKLEKDKEEATNKRDRLSDLKQLVTDHPALGNNLKGMMSATKEKKELEAELKSLETKLDDGTIVYTDPSRADKIVNDLIPKAEEKLTKNKEPLMDYISRKQLKITEKDIDEIANNDFVSDSKGNIDLNSTLSKNIAGLNRQIKGYDKSIKHHQIALNKINGRTEVEQTQVPAEETQIDQSLDGNEPLSMTGGAQPVMNNTYAVATPEKPKWYQFIKRFKNWNENRKRQALPEFEQINIDPLPETPASAVPASQAPEGITPEEVAPEQQKSDKQKFLDSLKYEVVQDVAKQMEQDYLREAKKEAKNERKSEDKSDDMER